MYTLRREGEGVLSERWWRRRKRRHPWFSDLFEESDRLEKMMDEMTPQTFSSQSSYYGSGVYEESEPLVDVIEEDREVVIVVELPGVKRENVQIHAAQCNVTISVDTMEHKYYKEVTLPVETDPESAVATYKNGVLQIRLKKLVNTQLFTK